MLTLTILISKIGIKTSLKKKNLKKLIKYISSSMTSIIFNIIYFFLIFIQKRGLHKDYIYYITLFFLIKFAILGKNFHFMCFSFVNVFKIRSGRKAISNKPGLSICTVSAKGKYFRKHFQIIHKHLINLMILCKYYYKIPDLLNRIDSLTKDPKYAKYMDYLDNSISLIKPKTLEIVSMPYPKIYFKLCLCLNIYQISIGSLIIIFISQRIKGVVHVMDKIIFFVIVSFFLFFIQIITDNVLFKLQRKNLYFKILKNKSLKGKEMDKILKDSKMLFKKANIKKFKEDG